MRKLVHIEYIHHIEPIEGADNIELVKLLGWQCVVKKGEFKVGDLGVYFEIDSFLPVEDRYEFMRSSSYKNSDLLGEGFKLRTMKMKGQLSQGLCLPLSLFPEITDPAIGDDVTELLNVRKWDIAERASTSGTIIGELPDFIHKTEEPRIQNVPDTIELYHRPYYITTKLDGTSCSIGLQMADEVDWLYEFYVCGHNYRYADDGRSTFYEYIKKNCIEDKLRIVLANTNRELEDPIKSIVISGEFCGEGIQKNPLRLMSPKWFPFTVEIDGKRCNLTYSKSIVEDSMELEFVPIEEIGGNFADKYPDVDSILKRAEGVYKSGKTKEGIVVRTIEGTLSFKAISNKYLLKQK